MYTCTCIIDTNRDVYLFLFTCNLILYLEFTITIKIVSSSYFSLFYFADAQLKSHSCEKMADRFPELSEKDSTSLVDRKNSENTKKGTYFESISRKGRRRVTRVIDAKDKLANA